MDKYSVVKLNENLIEEYSTKLNETWAAIWSGSFWGEVNRDEVDEKEYFLDLVKNGAGWMVLDDEQIIALGFETFNYDIHSVTDEERAFTEKNFKEPWAFINELVVLDGHRGEGIGGYLMDLLLEESIKSGCKYSYLYTESNSKSQNLYRRLGYEYMKEIIVPKENHHSGKELRAYYEKTL